MWSSKAFLLGGHLRQIERFSDRFSNVKMSELSWYQAIPPLVYEGLGDKESQVPAYLSSPYSTSDLSNEIVKKFSFQSIDSAVLRLSEEIPCDLLPEIY